MRMADLSMIPWISEFGSDQLYNAELKTAYDKLGRPSHLVAYLSNAHFQSMYGARAWSSVFIAGLWLLFQRAHSGYVVSCRTTGTTFECVFAKGALDLPEVSFFRRKKKLTTSVVRSLTLDELEWDDRGIHWLSKRLVRFIEKEACAGLKDWLKEQSHPSVHILPQRAQPKDFRAAAVLLQ